MTSALVALVALSVMEIVLGIDNIVFISIVSSRLPPEQQPTGRYVGLILAACTRIGLLCVISWIIGLVEPLFLLSDFLPLDFRELLQERAETDEVSVRDLILVGGGLFLIWTAVTEIHHRIEGEEESERVAPRKVSLSGVLFRIAVMDLVFSLDSVITAVGMAKEIWVMITAILISVAVMVIFANQVSDFVHRHPTVKMLALSFLLLIGVVLLSEGAGTPIAKGYVYFAMCFSLLVEILNLRMRSKRLRPGYEEGEVGSVRPPHTSTKRSV